MQITKNSPYDALCFELVKHVRAFRRLVEQKYDVHQIMYVHTLYVIKNKTSKKCRVPTLLTSSHREYYIFSGSPCRIIFRENSEKISSH